MSNICCLNTWATFKYSICTIRCFLKVFKTIVLPTCSNVLFSLIFCYLYFLVRTPDLTLECSLSKKYKYGTPLYIWLIFFIKLPGPYSKWQRKSLSVLFQQSWIQTNWAINNLVQQICIKLKWLYHPGFWTSVTQVRINFGDFFCCFLWFKMRKCDHK